MDHAAIAAVVQKLSTRDTAELFMTAMATWRANMERMERAVEEGDYFSFLTALTDLRKSSTELQDHMVVEAKRDGGLTWQEIGDAIKTPRQVAWRKYNARL